MEKENRRRIVLINRKFQITLILKFIAVNVFVTLLFCTFLYFFLGSEIEANLHSARITYQNMSSMLLPIIFTLAILNILVSSVIIAVFVLYASFRIAGPLYRFEAAIKEIAGGNLKPLLHLRNGDELSAFSVSLKEMVNYLINNVEKTRELSSRLKEVNQVLKHNELGEVIDQLDHVLNQMNT